MTRNSDPVLRGKSIGEIETYMGRDQRKSGMALLIAQENVATFAAFQNEEIAA
jgi:hypothetical protein